MASAAAFRQGTPAVGFSDDREKAKELQKELETPEEKYKRRMEKKLLKAQRKADDEKMLGYSNEANPFNDTNLSEAFVWKKKFEKLSAEGRLDPNWNKAIKRKREELKKEADEMKERRRQREKEKALAEEQRAELQRQEEARNALEFEKRGEGFAVLQLRQRREQRLADGRARARTIDYLSKNLDLVTNPDDPSHVGYQVEAREPYTMVAMCTTDELQELRNDAKAFVTYEKEGVAGDFWRSLMCVIDDELLRKKNNADSTAGAQGIHNSVTQEVFLKLQQKQPAELDKMEEVMSAKVKAGGSGVDVEYWTTILQHLQLLKSKARLREIHRQVIGCFLKRMEDSRETQKRSAQEEAAKRGKEEDKTKPSGSEKDDESEEEEEGSEAGGYSPVLEHGGAGGGDGGDTDDEREGKREERAQPKDAATSSSSSSSNALVVSRGGGSGLVDGDEDEIEQKRRKLEMIAEEKRRFMETERQQREEAKKMGLDDKLANDESLFADEYDLGKRKITELNDKFRPRKPKYFNRVHTGYDWNKYNRTHYDYENPPPKVVIGYKFNIFYPDLVDPSRQQPTYFVEPTEKGWNDDVCVIRFHAGPPYEDIAFKIVNKKWEYNNRRGFKCTFERGVLHLYFNFVRYFYRR